MVDSVTSFLEQYEWGYPFDQNEDTVAVNQIEVLSSIYALVA